MAPAFRTRRLAQLALTANALRPANSVWTSLPAFFAGWLTAELAPHLLAATAADTARHIVRREPTDWAAVGLAAATGAGMIALTRTAYQAHTAVEEALTEALGDDYQQTDPAAAEWRRLANPFRMHNAEVRRASNLPYAPGGRRYQLDIYSPRTPGTGRPVLLQVHGGGWMIGNKNQQGIPLMLHMAAHGWVCVAINYPLSPRARWPEHIIAAKRAVAWIRENIADYGGDPSFVAATGGSAGGHLSALLALSQNDPQWQPGFAEADTSVQACVPHYGAYDFAAQTSKAAALMQRHVLQRYVIGKDPRQHRDVYEAASPISRITADAPPFFVIHGAQDSLIPAGDSREFVRRLRAVSRQPVAYAEIPGAQHAFDVFPSIRSAHVVRGVQRFLDWAVLNHTPVSPEAIPGAAQRPR